MDLKPNRTWDLDDEYRPWYGAGLDQAGMGYTYGTKLKDGKMLVHTQYTCRAVQDHMRLKRFPLIHDDGKLFVVIDDVPHSTEMCPNCRRPDRSYVEEGLCWDREKEGVIDWLNLGNWANRRAAKAACDECPVALKCLEYADATDQPQGMWGGVIFHQRPSIRGERVRDGYERLRSK